MRAKILLLEDDIDLSDTIAQFLKAHNFEVIQCFDGLEAEDRLYQESFELLLLDVKVPLKSGFELLKSLREDSKDTPAIFITSLNSSDDATKGFELGCDDYIRKPFALSELLARVEAVIKRRYNQIDKLIKIDEQYTFNPIDFTLFKDNKRVPLKPKEAKLLALFLRNPNRTLSKEEIFSYLWDYDETPKEGSLRTFVKVLRGYIGKEKIETIKDVGYRFKKE